MSVIIDGTTGITTPGLTNTGTETIVNLTTTGNTILGDASTDTLNVGNGGLVKDASGNVGIGTSSPAVRMHVQGSAGQLMRVTDGTTGASIYSGGGLFGFNNQTGEDGMFGSTASHYLYFATNGAEAARINSSGNLGLGVTPSAYWGSTWKGIQFKTSPNFIAGGTDLNILANAYNDGTNYKYLDDYAYASRYYQYNGQHQWYTTTSTQGAGNTISFTQAMTLDASGNLSIGATSTSVKLLAAGTGFNISGNAYAVGTFAQDTTNYRGVFLGYDSTGQIGTISANSAGLSSALAFWTYEAGASLWAERVRIDGSGNLLVGKTSTADSVVGSMIRPTGYITSTWAESTDATTTYHVYSTGASAYRFYVGLGGTVFATSIVISAISDQRLKENVRDIETGLDSIMALKPRRFDWKEGKGQDKKNVAGFIAQEFEDVFPECVSTSKAGADGIEYKNINHETLIPTLVKAIQEQQALITQLTARITALEGAA